MRARAATALSRLAFGVGLGAALLPTPAYAFPDSVAIELQTTLGGQTEWVGNTSFTGQGTLLTTGQMASFQASGSDLGLVNPWQTVVGFRLGVVIGRYLGISGGMSGKFLGGADRPPANPDLAALVDRSALDADRYDGEVTGILPLGPVSLRLGLNIGYRYLGAPITAYALIACGKTQCPPDAEQSGLALGPRLWFTAPVFPGGIAQILAYAGADVLPPFGFATGIGMMVHLPLFQAATK